MVRHSLYVLFLYIFQRNTILRNLFSNVLFSMKMFELRLKFHWSLFPGVQLTLLQHWCRQWLGAVQATSHYLNQWWLVYRRIYASVGLNELKTSLFSIQLNWHTRGKWLIHGAKYFKDNHNHNKSAKGAYTWSSPVCRSMCEGSEYMNLSVTKRKIILNVTISKLLVLVSMSGIWFSVYINNISALV